MTDTTFFSIFPDSTNTGTWYVANLFSEVPKFEFVNVESVQLLAETLQTGSKDALLQLFPNAFVDLNAYTPEEVFDILFSMTTRAFYTEYSIFTAPAGDFLADFLVAVGDALAAVAATFKTADAKKREAGITNGPPPNVVRKLLGSKILGVRGTPADMSQTWQNFSPQSFSVKWEFYNPFANLITTPKDSLHASDTTSLSWYQAFSTGWSQECDGSVLLTGSDGVSFGVNIHVPQQIADIGTAPYYQVWQGTGTPDWESSVQRNSEPYIFQGLSCGAVKVVASASHSSLSLVVVIPFTKPA